jgi:hypothetical protein
MTWRNLLVLFLTVILAVGLLLGQTTPGVAAPNVGGGFALIYDLRGEVLRPAVTWSLSLTKAPSTPLIADGLLVSDGRYGVGLTTPLPTLTTPLFKAVGVTPSETFEGILNAVYVGGAVLGTGLDDMDGGVYARVTAFSF